MGKIKDIVNDVKEKERNESKHRKSLIRTKFNQEKKVVVETFMTSLSEFINLLPSEGIKWKVLPEEYPFPDSGRVAETYDGHLNWQVMFYIGDTDAPHPSINHPNQCIMDFIPGKSQYREFEKKWQEPKWRCRHGETPGQWDLEHLALWIHDELIVGHEKRSAREIALRIVEDGSGKQYGKEFQLLSNLYAFAKDEIGEENALFYSVTQQEPDQPTIHVTLEDVYEAYSQGECPEDLDFF